MSYIVHVHACQFPFYHCIFDRAVFKIATGTYIITSKKRKGFCSWNDGRENIVRKFIGSVVEKGEEHNKISKSSRVHLNTPPHLSLYWYLHIVPHPKSSWQESPRISVFFLEILVMKICLFKLKKKKELLWKKDISKLNNRWHCKDRKEFCFVLFQILI